MQTCVAPIEKFRDYIFKPGATHGKDHVFHSLGYDKSHSAQLASIFEQQAAVKYASGEFTPGRRDEHGQRINIMIELAGVDEYAHQTSYLISGWMIGIDGSIRLNTPFSGFARLGVIRMFKNYSRVRLQTEKYTALGASIFDVGYIIESYPNGDYEVEFSNASGITTAQIVARKDELELAPVNYPAPQPKLSDKVIPEKTYEPR